MVKGASNYELPCEYAAKNIFPSIRASIATILVKDKRMSKYMAAKVLGTTPAAVTYYIVGKRGDKYSSRILEDRELRKLATEAADVLIELSEGETREKYMRYQQILCSICSRLNKLAQERGCPALIFGSSGRGSSV